MRRENRVARRLALLLACSALAALALCFTPPESESRADAPAASATPPPEGPDPDAEHPDAVPVVSLKPSPPPALQCGAGAGHDTVAGQIEAAALKPGSNLVRVRFDDPNRLNEARTLFSLKLNRKTYQYHGDFDEKSSVAQLFLPEGVFLMVGDSVTVTVDEQYTSAAPDSSGTCLKSKPTALAPRRPAFRPNPILLRHSSADEIGGCHGQSVKFDGVYFFSSCQELGGSDSLAVANIHDADGNRLCRFTLEPEYDHPGGIVIFPGETGVAYLGFSKWGGDLPSEENRAAQPIKIAYDRATGKCLLAPVKLNKGALLPNTTGFAVRLPEDRLNRHAGWKSDIFFYDDYTAFLNKCPKSGEACVRGEAITKPAPKYSSQDCGYYWAGRWFRACIAFVSTANTVQVFEADAVSMHEGARLKTFDLGPATLPWSAGLDIYESRDGAQRFVILAPNYNNNSLNCDGRQPCTTSDSNRAQYVEVHDFNRWNSYWPTSATNKTGD